MTISEGALHDLNDLRFFAAVVEHRGFSAAGRALGTPKSRLSKRVAQLEERLGVRLLQRTTRRFAVTDIGERFYAHCRAALEEAQAAQDVVDELRAEPRGIVRVSCPTSLVQTIIAHVLPDFLTQCPKVQVRVLATNRRVDVIGEGFDLAIRVRNKLDTDATLVLRTFGQSRVLLVASAAFLDLNGRPQQPDDLERLPLLSMLEHDGAQIVELSDADGNEGEHRDDRAPRLRRIRGAARGGQTRSGYRDVAGIRLRAGDHAWRTRSRAARLEHAAGHDALRLSEPARAAAERPRVRRIPRRTPARRGADETRAMHATQAGWTSGAWEEGVTRRS